MTTERKHTPGPWERRNLLNGPLESVFPLSPECSKPPSSCFL
jgi:hypothetical protein